MTKISTIITAGGNSVRFGSNKLLEYIDDKTVIETTISKFINLSDEIIIPAGDEIKEHVINSEIYNEKIKFAPPGTTRQKSVYNGIMACSKPDIVLIHDAARPFIDCETIKKTIELTVKNHAVVVAARAIDTIKKVENNKIIKTLDRSKIFHAQTPQAFDYDLIKKIHEQCKDNPDFTDDSSMAEALGVEVYILENCKKNIKITVKEDL